MDAPSTDAQATVNELADETFPDPDTFAQPAPAGHIRAVFGRTEVWGTLANQLLAAIAEGTYHVGSKLPSVRILAKDAQVAEGTAQRALQALVTAGVAQAAGRSGYYVTAIPAHPAELMPPPGTTPAYTQHQANQRPGYAPQWTPQPSHQAQPAPTIRPASLVPAEGQPSTALAKVASLTISAEQAPPDIAQALRLPDPQAVVIVRRRLLTDEAGQVPTELRTSHLPTDIAEATPLLSPIAIPGPWPQALAQHSRRAPVTVDTYTTARRATEPEAAALRLAPPAIVLVRDTVTSDAQGQPIDATRSVWPAEATTIEHRYPFPT